MQIFLKSQKQNLTSKPVARTYNGSLSFSRQDKFKGDGGVSISGKQLQPSYLLSPIFAW